MENQLQLVENIKRVEYRDQLVLTTAQLAEFYECTVDNIYDNFRKNRDRFIEGNQYFKLEGDELRMFKREQENLRLAKNINVLYLWTKRGAARHAKMLNTDRAWEVFEALEDNYFNRPAAVNHSAHTKGMYCKPSSFRSCNPILDDLQQF